MKKIVKITESDLEKIVLRIIKEQSINTSYPWTVLQQRT